MGNVISGTVSLSVLYFPSYVYGNTMSQMLSIWGGAHPLKLVGHPLKFAVRPRKSFLSDLGVGSV